MEEQDETRSFGDNIDTVHTCVQTVDTTEVSSGKSEDHSLKSPNVSGDNVQSKDNVTNVPTAASGDNDSVLSASDIIADIMKRHSEKQSKEQEKQDVGSWIPREHEPLWSLLSQIPKKAQRGLLMQCDLILTCVDADENFIALGTNIGITFLYHRNKQSLERLKSESSSDVVTCVQLHHGIDYQLAVGMASGTIYIFQLPSMMTGLNKQLQKFHVTDMHRTYLTCIEWSTNGMRLFSGDKLGTVVSTEVDFYQGQCKSDVLIEEPGFAVVQLHYDHKALVISNKKRSFVCRLDEDNKIFQIGQQERKVDGNFGACFIPGFCKTSDAQLYAARPALRLWKSDINGTVLNTNIFRDLIGPNNPEIQLVKPEKLINPVEFQFGKLCIYRGNQILSWTQNCLLVLDPDSNSVVARLDRAGYISDVSVHQDEIFVLRRNTETDLIRLALKPEAVPKVHHLLLEHQLTTTTSPDSLIKSVTSLISPTSNKSSPDDQDNSSSKHVSPKAFIKKNIFEKLNKLLDVASPDSASSRPLGQQSEVSVKQLIEGGTSSDGEQADVPKSISPELPPVVKLGSPELPSLYIYSSNSGSPLSPSASEVLIDSSASNTPMSCSKTALVDSEKVDENKQRINDDKLLAEEVSNIEHHIALISERVHIDDNVDDSEDLVYSHKSKKHKKKKAKQGNVKKKDDDEISENSDSFSSQTNEVTANPPQCTSQVKPISSLDPDETLRIADEILKRTNELIRGRSSPSSVLEDDLSSEMLSSKPDTSSRQDVSPKQKVSSKQNTSAKQDQFSKQNTSSADSQTSSAPKRPQDIPYVYSVDHSNLPDINTTGHVFKKLNEKAAVISSTYEAVQSDSNLSTQNTQQSVGKSSDGGFYSTSDTSTDDFYKKYRTPASPSSTDSLTSPLENVLSPQAESDQRPHVVHKDVSELDSNLGNITNGTLHRIANSWSEISAPANIYSLVLSDSHIWFTDKSEHIYFSALNSAKGVVWRKASGSASQVSVSHNGKIVWRLHKGTAYAGTKITTKHPEGLKWVEAVRDVAFISVDDSCAWYVKNDGTVMIQKGLSIERPCFRSLKVNCIHVLRQIVCRDGVVWAVTKDYRLIYRKGITAQCVEGTDWDVVDVNPEGLLCSSVALSDQDTGWALDLLGRVWFCTGVTRQTPTGDGNWWQVPMSEYFVQDTTAIDTLRSLAKTFDPQKLSFLVSTNRGGLIAAGSAGTWVCFGYKNILNVCRGNFIGYRWTDAQLIEMAPSVVWKIISACNADAEWGRVWAQQPNGELYAFSKSTNQGNWVSPSPLFLSLHAGPTAVWGLDDTGKVLVRAGMGPYCPLGASWSELDLSQLGDVQLMYISCNAMYVWAADCNGQVYQRIGAKAPQDQQLSPAWLPIDSFSDIVFTKVVIGPLDWMVWAVDNRRLAYVRAGITEEMPIGKEWLHVPGTQVTELALSKTGVWALNLNGEILFRYGISLDNICGDYWKKLPGVFSHLSVSSSDDLWALTLEGHLQHCHMKYILRRQLSSDQSLLRTMSSGSEEGEWELV